MIEADFQTALFAKLSGVAGGRVYDKAPQVADGAAQTYPYVTYGTAVLTSRDGGDRLGFEVAFRLHTWDDSALLVRTTQAAIFAALHDQDFSAAGFDTVWLRRNDTDVIAEADGVFHGVCEYNGRLSTLRP